MKGPKTSVQCSHTVWRIIEWKNLERWKRIRKNPRSKVEGDKKIFNFSLVVVEINHKQKAKNNWKRISNFISVAYTVQ